MASMACTPIAWNGTECDVHQRRTHGRTEELDPCYEAMRQLTAQHQWEEAVSHPVDESRDPTEKQKMEGEQGERVTPE